MGPQLSTGFLYWTQASQGNLTFRRSKAIPMQEYCLKYIYRIVPSIPGNPRNDFFLGGGEIRCFANTKTFLVQRYYLLHQEKAKGRHNIVIKLTSHFLCF